MGIDGLVQAVCKSFDGYSRKARLYPALICLVPILWTAFFLLSLKMDNPALQATVALAGSIGGMYLFASVARSRGKTLEGKLLKLWGGWPTTVLLRHRDDRLDRYTKARYHSALEKLTGLPLPSVADENVDPVDADQRYRAATTRLLELRRDEKYRFVHHENASYGFRRNLRGLRSVAISLLIILTAITIGGICLNLSEWSITAIRSDLSFHWNFYVALALNAISVVFWIIFVTKDYVQQGANEYALALFRTLDEG